MPTKISFGEQTDLDAAIDGTNQKVANVADPTTNQDAATKKYVDDNSDTFVENENLSSQADGTAVIFTTANPYVATSIKVYQNGMRTLKVTDYTETDATSITFTSIPDNSDTVVVDYRTP